MTLSRENESKSTQTRGLAGACRSRQEDHARAIFSQPALSNRDQLFVNSAKSCPPRLDVCPDGLLAEKDFQELSLIRLDLDREGTGADERVNLLDLCRRQRERLREELRDLRERTAAGAADASPEAPLLRRLEWLQKFAAIHANPASAGVNALV